MSLSFDLLTAFVALLLEAALGYPNLLFRSVEHPVIWMGALLGRLEARLNRENMPEERRRLNGAIAVGILLAATILPALALQLGLFWLLPRVLAVLYAGFLASTLIAQRSLHTHVRAVADALDREGLDAARAAVAKIVGRDTKNLNPAGVGRAAIESLAENFSDGVVAPVFWCALAGLPGIAAYKAANTADSMIGHRSPRYAAFGFAAAKLDDWLNLPASRLAALWIVLAAVFQRDADAWASRETVQIDARHHSSPNAGWPESAMAGALKLKLSGPRSYEGAATDEAWIGRGRQKADAADIRRALRLYRIACALQIAVYGAITLLIARG
jgi:adenosylcobinamide-phosphate synthase